MIVLLLIGMLSAAGVMGIGSVFRTKLRSAAGRTAGAMQVAFDKARLTGMYVRLALDLKQGKLWLEGSSQGFSLKRGAEQHVTTDADEGARQEAARARPSKSLLPTGLGADEGSAEGEGAGEGLFGVDKAFIQGFEQDLEPIERPKAYFQPVKGPGSATLALEGGVRFARVMTAHLEEPAEDGIAYIYFFPQGHAEPAIVQLRDGHEGDYSVVLNPLTGQAKVYACRYRIPKMFGEPEEGEVQPAATRLEEACEDR